MSSNSNIHSTQILKSLEIEVYGVICFVLWIILGLSSREMELQKRIAGLHRSSLSSVLSLLIAETFKVVIKGHAKIQRPSNRA